ncbi:hypothetical protein CCAX7_43990 [Capsulimonas corticalis]|uniref:Uncharacterized protein n=1 Tax=Capsulimonas corticalis TaxID=2219043 RepID=A0A402CXB4_9BACT|nr:hypothetical protein CCAX7_43990 [Capsulimonas corticalis]
MPGTYLQAFIKNGRHFFVTEIKIYKDGMIDCWGFVDFEGFQEKIRSGWVRTRLPEGARVSMMESLNFTATDVKAGVEEVEFVKQVADEILSLNKKPTSAHFCGEALRQYKQDPTESNRERLRTAYEAVPKHMRLFLGDMDSKDWEYKRILDEKNSD